MVIQRMWLCAVLLLAGCGGEHNRGPGGGSSTSSSTSSASSSSSSSASSSASSSSGAEFAYGCGICQVEGVEDSSGPLVVISSAHYRQRLQQLLIEASPGVAAETLALEPYSGRNLFVASDAPQRLELAFEAFYRTAEAIAGDAIAVACGDISAENCAALFIAEFVEPLFERPLTPAEREEYLSYFNDAQQPQSDGQRRAMTAALSSPHFLFRKQIEVQGGDADDL